MFFTSLHKNIITSFWVLLTSIGTHISYGLGWIYGILFKNMTAAGVTLLTWDKYLAEALLAVKSGDTFNLADFAEVLEEHQEILKNGYLLNEQRVQTIARHLRKVEHSIRVEEERR